MDVSLAIDQWGKGKTWVLSSCNVDSLINGGSIWLLGYQKACAEESVSKGLYVTQSWCKGTGWLNQSRCFFWSRSAMASCSVVLRSRTCTPRLSCRDLVWLRRAVSRTISRKNNLNVNNQNKRANTHTHARAHACTRANNDEQSSWHKAKPVPTLASQQGVQRGGQPLADVFIERGR